MQVDTYGQLIYSEKDILDVIYKNPDIILDNVLMDKSIDIDYDLLHNNPKFLKYSNPNISIKEFDKVQQENFALPNEYKNMDIAKWVLEQCKTDEELQRTGQELLLFQERNMFPLLQYLKYLVDTMRTHNIVWGVGRGSSVASFVLYLIGVHKINSLYYDIPIEEFLR